MASTYSLWLLPDDDAAARLQTVINGFARRFSTPVFRPHITLYSGIVSNDEIAVIAKCREIIACCPPVEVHLESVGMEDGRFRCLYVRVRNTPELALLFNRAEAVFRCSREWQPHISLLYGVISRSEKEGAVREEYGNPIGRAKATALALCNTSGDVHQWREIAHMCLLP